MELLFTLIAGLFMVIGTFLVLFTNNNKKIISSNKEAAEWSIDDNGNLYILSNNKVEKYNVAVRY